MLHTTKGIVLRTIKYGDTSIVVSIYTELFGIQSYLVNGVRTERKSASKANIYQPSTLLDLIVYHTPNKNLQRIKEARVHTIYQKLQTHIVRNTIAVYIAELIGKTITEPETHIELFDFFESSFLWIEHAAENELANFPLIFSLHYARHLGFGIQDVYHPDTPILDLQNGRFCSKQELLGFDFIEGETAQLISNLCNDELLKEIPLTQQKRKELLGICIQYLRLHIPHLPELKSVAVLHEIFEA